ncbi:hypothetical protein MRB53_040388 [Persea americana]|nr:hypothetical protein MRB53_040388 [Persea americana]
MRLGLAEKTVIVALAHAMVAHEVSQEGDKIASTEQLAKGETILKSVFSFGIAANFVLEFRSSPCLRSRLSPSQKSWIGSRAKTSRASTNMMVSEHRFTLCHTILRWTMPQRHRARESRPRAFRTSSHATPRICRRSTLTFSPNCRLGSKKGLPASCSTARTVAWDVAEKKVLPFQQLMTRKRKDVKVEDVKVKVCVFAFDLLFLNGEALVTKSFRERRELMRSAFAEVEGEFAFAKYGNTNELEEIQILLDESVKASCEGLMVKMLDGVESNYEPSRRSQNWLKVKKDYLAGVGDSLDLVVLGAYFGKGKRTSVYGAFLLACYEPRKQEYETVCNIGTGFSEAVLEELHSQLEPIIIDRPKPFYSHSAGNKISPTSAEVLDSSAAGKGVSLRFPRFLKVRDDKKPDDATTSRAVAEMYKKQESVSKNKGPSADDDFEY